MKCAPSSRNSRLCRQARGAGQPAARHDGAGRGRDWPGLCLPLLCALACLVVLVAAAPAAVRAADGGVSMGGISAAEAASRSASFAGIRPVPAAGQARINAATGAASGAPTARAAALDPRAAQRVSEPGASGPLAPSAVYAGAPALPAGAITVHPYASMKTANSLDDYDDEPVASIADPIEPWNRF